MMFIGIMYKDLDADGNHVIQWEPVENIDALKKTDVLCIAITTERGNRRALVYRAFNRLNSEGERWYGDDNYVIGFIGGRFFTKQWAGEDEYILTRSLADPNSTVYQKHPIKQQLWPPEAVVHQFKGAIVPMDEWNEAIRVFETEMF